MSVSDKYLKNIEDLNNKLISDEIKYTENIFNIILPVLEKYDVIMYGGYAMDIQLKRKGHEGIYDEKNIADIDIYHWDYINIGVEVADLLHNKGFKYVKATRGMHSTTYKVSVELSGVLDISFLPKRIYEKMIREKNYTQIGKFKYVDPNFIKRDQYKICSLDLFTDAFRIKKSLERLKILEKEFPIKHVVKKIKFVDNFDFDIELPKNSVLTGHNLNLLFTGKKIEYPLDLINSNAFDMIFEFINKGYKIIEKKYTFIHALNHFYEIYDHKKHLYNFYYTPTPITFINHKTKNGNVIKIANYYTQLAFLYTLYTTNLTDKKNIIDDIEIALSYNAKLNKVEIIFNKMWMFEQIELIPNPKSYFPEKEKKPETEYIKDIEPIISQEIKKTTSIAGTLNLKILPYKKDVNYEEILYLDNSKYFITPWYHSKLIVADIIKTFGKNINIYDLTAHIGGDTIAFGLAGFKNVYSYEIDKQTFLALENNIKTYGLKNVKAYNKSGLTAKLNDVVYMDPPWGGPNYKDKTNLELYLDKIPVSEIIKNMTTNKKIKGIYVKLPINYDFAKLPKKHEKIPMKKMNKKIQYYVVKFIL